MQRLTIWRVCTGYMWIHVECSPLNNISNVSYWQDKRREWSANCFVEIIWNYLNEFKWNYQNEKWKIRNYSTHFTCSTICRDQGEVREVVRTWLELFVSDNKIFRRLSGSLIHGLFRTLQWIDASGSAMNQKPSEKNRRWITEIRS